MFAITCPVCGKRFQSEKSESLPFCCERCRLIDLKRWLGEEYSMPARETDPEDEDEFQADVPADDDE